jgi:DNA-binding FadR family transcriptional regulator
MSDSINKNSQIMTKRTTKSDTENLKITTQNFIRAYIQNNRLVAGDPLPPEKTLVEATGVSRAVVREALQSLQALGLTEAVKGKGHFVKGFSFEAMLSNLDFLIKPSLGHFKDLLEIRMYLEPEFLARNIGLFTKKDVNDLTKILELIEARIRGEEGEDNLITLHEHFHRTLFKYCDNNLLLELISLFTNLQHKFTKIHGYKTTNREDFLIQHRMIVESIALGNQEILRLRYLSHFTEPFGWVKEKLEANTLE